jgi:hypothetical protein
VTVALYFFILFFNALYGSGLSAINVADSLNRGITSLQDLQVAQAPFAVPPSGATIPTGEEGGGGGGGVGSWHLWCSHDANRGGRG